MKKKPNIVLIMTDNQPPELLGCYGNEEVKTPHIDRLAQQGIKATNAFCTNAMCSPCRASVLTGLMPSQHGIHSWLDDREMNNWPDQWNALAGVDTLPEILQQNGYQTALIGKYHLGVPEKPQNGFVHWVTFPHGHTVNFWNNRVIDNDETYTYEGHTVDFFTEKAVSYLEQRDVAEDEPFFLFLSYNAPYGHWPSVRGEPKNRFADLYRDCPATSVPRVGISREAIEHYVVKREASGGGLDFSAALMQMNDLPTLRNYFSQMSLVDDGVGQVMAALDRNGLDQDTLVIYTCDHGFSLGSNGFWGHGISTWPANTHRAAFQIPLLIRHTEQIAPNQESAELISQIDLFPTLLDYADIERPEGWNSPALSLMERLQDKPYTGHDMIFMEQEETRSVRTSEWLLMTRFAGSPTYDFQDELYDLVNDPGETVNLATAPAYQDIVGELRQQIEQFFGRYADPRYDLWHGGAAKGSSHKPWLWQECWGKEWDHVFE